MILDVVIEIPKGSRNKYELDKETGQFRLDRVLRSSVGYPADYGFLPGTLSEDGDPADVMIISRFPTFPGCVMSARVIAVFKMIDTGEADEKIIAVPQGDNYYESWNDLSDIPQAFKDEIEQFFKTYKNLEKSKHIEVQGWGDVKEAEEAIKKATKNEGN